MEEPCGRLYEWRTMAGEKRRLSAVITTVSPNAHGRTLLYTETGTAIQIGPDLNAVLKYAESVPPRSFFLWRCWILMLNNFDFKLNSASPPKIGKWTFKWWHILDQFLKSNHVHSPPPPTPPRKKINKKGENSTGIPLKYSVLYSIFYSAVFQFRFV